MSELQASITFLQQLVATSSFSKKEEHSANLLEQYLKGQGLVVHRKHNNVWARNFHFDANKPSILLNSHHDTVQPNTNYMRDPFAADIAEGRLYGLGSNDAGGALVCLLFNFLSLVFAATAEEEISGENGIASILSEIGPIDFAIVGEPTALNMAIAEKGLMVIDAYAHGKAGHAAHNNHENAIEIAMRDIQWLQKNFFEDVSTLLGPVKTTVTQINAGTQHNVVPDQCHFVIDVRTNEKYSNQEVFDLLSKHLQSKLIARSFRLNSSGIPEDHILIDVAQKLGIKTYGSPTLSDQALMPFPSVKIGPGESSRSHTADEFITLEELEAGLHCYQQILKNLVL
ncbi:MAG: M20 family metallo-hydrolase [Luteibaculum sp.]